MIIPEVKKEKNKNQQTQHESRQHCSTHNVLKLLTGLVLVNLNFNQVHGLVTLLPFPSYMLLISSFYATDCPLIAVHKNYVHHFVV